jgi:putative membrane-bound dehydrogenase-like protein
MNANAGKPFRGSWISRRWPARRVGDGGWLAIACFGVGWLCAAQPACGEDTARLMAGAAVMDISPQRLPVIQNGGFLPRTTTRLSSPIFARSLALRRGESQAVLVIVDSCMIPRDVCDLIKEEASAAGQVRSDQILIAATHTHSAPSTMDYCLGSMKDKEYTVQVIPQIAEVIRQSLSRLEPALAGHAVVEAWDYTNSRRWIKRSDKLGEDPFGKLTVRAMMHPNPLSDYVGPSGPEDPGLTILSIVRPDRSPLAVLSNFSMHYHGNGEGIHPDYFGIFTEQLEAMVRQGHPDRPFTAMMSQGTSGDLHLRTYDPDRIDEPAPDIQRYAQGLASLTHGKMEQIEYSDTLPIAIAQQELQLTRRVPDAERLAWARQLEEARGDAPLKNRPEVYAMQAVWIHEHPETSLVLQALRVGELGITAIPNEVYGITGLKIKEASPLAATMNIELANGAEGYIPPPEQHVLGGYTTWPSRTAGLEVQAEPKIVEAILTLLEQVAGKPRRVRATSDGPAAEAVRGLKPYAFYRFEEIQPPVAHDSSGSGRDGRLEDGVAYYLPGVGSSPATDMASAIPEQPSIFSGPQINRALHFAGGRLQVPAESLPRDYSVALWFWNGFPPHERPITGYLWSRGDENPGGEHLGIGGTLGNTHGKLIFFDGEKVLEGQTILKMRHWHHVVFVRSGDEIRVHLDGHLMPELQAKVGWKVPEGVKQLFVGGRSDGQFGLEGKIDEVAIFDRPLDAQAIHSLFAISGRPQAAATVAAPVPKVQPPISSQPALEPRAALAAIEVPAGFRLELVASEPQVCDPVAMDWDARGRLWVVEMADYPLGMDNQGAAGGRVKVLEDRDGDGFYESATLFAEGLSFPNGILTWREGAIVTAAPDILYLQDTNGDGKADRREVLITGLNEGNQQLRPNGLRWGLDGWVYVASGSPGAHYTNKTPLKSLRTGLTIELGTRDFRFRPDTGELAIESGPTQFGRTRDDWGHWFGTQNAKPLWHYVLSERYLARNPYLAVGDTTRQLLISPPPVYPALTPEKRFHNFAQAGHYTSACAGVIHRDPRMFGSGLQAFVCEPFHNLAQQLELRDDGITFAGRAVTYGKRDFLTSTDRWFRPVMVRTGPDGGLWVADMYRFMIEHPQFLPPEGKEELLPHYRRGDDRGRIYRIHRADAVREPLKDLSRLTTAEWVKLLGVENGFLRDKAHQLLLWRGDVSVEADLRRAAQRPAEGLGCLHALWVMEGLGLLTPADLLPALSAATPGLCANAIRLAEPWLRQGDAAGELLASVRAAADHPDPKVQLQAALSLGESPSPLAGEALARLMLRHVDDRLFLTAVLSSAQPHLEACLQAYERASTAQTRGLLQPLLQLSIGLRHRDAIARLLRTLDGEPQAEDTRVRLERMLDAMKVSGVGLTQLAEVSAEDALGRELQRVDRLLDRCLAFAADENQPFEQRLPVALMTAHSPAQRAASLELIAGWLDATQALDVQLSVIQSLTQGGADNVPDLFVDFWPSAGPSARQALIEGWLSREPWCLDLLARIKRKQLPVAALDATHRSRLLNHQAGRVVNQAKLVLGNQGSNRVSVIAGYRQALSLTPDLENGHRIYQKVCAACHRHGQEGVAIGPDMAAFVSHAPDKLLTNILDPNIDIQPGYQAFLCSLSSGEQLYGVVTQENATSLSIKGKDGMERTILRSEIEAMKGTNISFMPEGLEEAITVQQMADLLAFLKQPALPGKPALPAANGTAP